MNYFPVGGVSGKIKVDGEKVDLRNIKLVAANVEDTAFTSTPYRFYDGSVVVLDGEIHILGSQTHGSDWTYYNTHYKWKDGTWVQVSTLPYSFAAGAAVVLNGEIHILGGYNGNYLGHYKWDGSTWTEASILPYTGRWIKAVVLNGEIHLLGTYDSPNTQKHYKWDGNTWTEVSTLPYGFDYGSAVVLNNEIHALGIANGGYHYKWDGSTWTKVSDLPSEFKQIHFPSVVLNNEIHIFNNYHYKWDGSTWSGTNIHTSQQICNGGAAVYENGIHVIGGGTNNSGSSNHNRLHVKRFVVSINS